MSNSFPESCIYFLIPLSGYVILFMFRKFFKQETIGLKIIVSYILGSFAISVIPVIANIVLGLSFSFIVRIISSLFIVLAFYILFSHLKHLNSYKKISLNLTLRIRFDPLSISLMFSYLFYVIKTIVVLFISPILSGDAIYLWIPLGKVIYVADRIPSFDIYHFFRFTEGPVLPSFYAIYFVFKNDIYSEGFWTLPLIFMLVFPLIIYELAKIYVNRDVAKIATILFTALPGNDFISYFYAYYPDLFAIFFGLSGILFTGRVVMKKDRNKKIDIIISSLSFALSLLTRVYIGAIILSITLISVIVLLDYLSLFVRIATSVSFVILLAYVYRNYGMSIDHIYILVLSTLSITSVVTIKKKITIKFFSNLLMILAFITFFLSPWIIRNIFLTGKMEKSLPIPLVTSYGSEVLDDTNIYQLQKLLNPLISPWINSYMVGLWLYILVFFAILRHPSSLSWGEEYLRTTMFFSYVISSIIMFNLETGRHVYFLGIFLCIALAMLLQHNNVKEKLVFLTTFYLFSYLNYPTLYFLELRDELLHDLLSPITIPYQTNYPVKFLLSNYFLSILIISLITFYILASKFFVSDSKGFKKKSFPTMLLTVFILIATLNPVIFLTYANNLTNGNLLNFKSEADWYKSQRIIAEEINEIIKPDQRVLTYADVILDYYLIKNIDLYHSFSILKEYCPIDDNLYNCLKTKLNVTYVLIPTEKHYAYSNFLLFIEKYPQFCDIFLQKCIKIKEYNDYTLCVLK